MDTIRSLLFPASMIWRMIKLNIMRKVMTFYFYKEDDNWYVDIPEYPGPKRHLQMVGGADDLLDRLCEDSGNLNYVYVNVSLTHPIASSNYYALLKETNTGWLSYGKDYRVMHFVDSKLQRMSNETGTRAWLCPVMLYVFGGYPKVLYIYQ